MKRILLTAGICIASLCAVQAQQTAKTPMKASPNAGQQVEKTMKNMTSACNLTPDQVTKVKPVITQFVNEKMANKQKFGTDKDKMMEANTASKKATKAKLDAILTPEQQQKWTAFQKQKEAGKGKEEGDKDKE